MNPITEERVMAYRLFLTFALFLFLALYAASWHMDGPTQLADPPEEVALRTRTNALCLRHWEAERDGADEGEVRRLHREYRRALAEWVAYRKRRGSARRVGARLGSAGPG